MGSRRPLWPCVLSWSAPMEHSFLSLSPSSTARGPISSCSSCQTRIGRYWHTAMPPSPYSGPLSQWNVRYPILTWRRSAHRGAAGPNTISKHRFTRHPSCKLSSMLLYVHRDHIRTTDWGRGAQDGHLDFYRAPEPSDLSPMRASRTDY